MAQCLCDGIARNEQGICLRNIYPSMDFDMKIEHDSWKVQYPTVTDELEYVSWQISSHGYNRDRSVVCIYGICNMSLIKQKCYGTKMRFWWGNVKCIDIAPLDQFENGLELLATPILYKKNDNIRITISCNKETSEKVDWIKLVGIVGEPVGCWVAP